MSAPNSSPDSRSERNQQPAVKKNHKDAEHSQKCPPHRVRLWLAEQEQRTDADRNSEETHQSINGWPPPDCPPVELSQRAFARTMVHMWSNAWGERPPPTGTVERMKHERIVAQRWTEKRGGGSSPPICWAAHFVPGM